MKALTDILHRMEIAGTYGVHDTREWAAVEALARHGGSAELVQLSRTARLGKVTASGVMLSLAGFRLLHRFDPHPFVTLEKVNLASLGTFNLPDETEVKFTARGWQLAVVLGYGRPSLIVPQSSLYAPEIAEPDAEAHRARLQMQHPLTVWSIEPEVLFHEA